MHKESTAQRFTGDISAQDVITTSAKGGSIIATLKRSITQALGMADMTVADASGKSPHRRLAAACVEIDPANKLLLIATQATVKTSTLVVRRTGTQSIEISVQDHGGDEIDEIEAAFVELKRAQFADGQLALSAPMTADEFEAMTDHVLAAAKAHHNN